MNWFFKINQKSKIKNQKEKLFIGKIETSKLKLLGWDIMVKSKSKSQKSKVKEQRVKSKIQKEKDKRQNFETEINEEKKIFQHSAECENVLCWKVEERS
jgi:hypothetical protein